MKPTPKHSPSLVQATMAGSSRQHVPKKRPREMTIRRLVPALALAATTTSFLPLLLVTAQTDAFTRQVPCPSDITIQGYTSIADINKDMEAEVARVTAGGARLDSYSLSLCPGTFDATGGNILTPVLDQVTISCGDGSGGVDSTCIIDGSREQLRIEDPRAGSNYTLSAVTVEGVIFSGLKRGSSSIVLDASAPTTFTCRDCVWQDFDDSDFVVDITGSMTFVLENGVVRTSPGRSSNAHTNEAIVNVGQGTFQAQGLLVDGITSSGDIVKASGDGSKVSLVDTVFTNNVVGSNIVFADEGATVQMSKVNVEKNERFSTGFIASNGATLIVSNTTFLNNVQARPWDGIVASGGGRVSVVDSLMQGNQGLQFGILSEGVKDQGVGTLSVERTNFVNNVGFEDPDNGPRAVVATIGNSAGNPILNLKQIQFEGNSGFIANFMSLLGGQIIMRQACFSGNSNTLIGFEGKGGQSTVFGYNFIDDNESSLGCAAADARLGIEPDTSDGCFTEASQGNCQVNCGGPIADSDVCLAEIDISESPTMSPGPSSSPTGITGAPSTSPAPSFSPSAIPSISPSKITQSNAPSDAPGNAPSGAPGIAPSDAPGNAPSGAPGIAPSDAPGNAPSDVPGNAGSEAPSSNGGTNGTESVVPSVAPTTALFNTSEAPTSSLVPTTTPVPTFVPTTTILPGSTLPPIYRPGCFGKGFSRGSCAENIQPSTSSGVYRRSRLSKKMKRSKRTSDKESKKFSRSSRSGKGKGKSNFSSMVHSATIDQPYVLGVTWGGVTDNKDRLNNLIRDDDDAVNIDDRGQRQLRDALVEVAIDPEMKNPWYSFNEGTYMGDDAIRTTVSSTDGDDGDMVLPIELHRINEEDDRVDMTERI